MSEKELKLLMMVIKILPALIEDGEKVAAKLKVATDNNGKVKDVLSGVITGLETIVGALV